MVIKIISVGKLKEKYWQEAAAEYCKRLNKYAKVETIEINEEKIPEENQSYIEIAKIAEGKRILNRINPSDYVFLMEIKGKQNTSLELSRLINQTIVEGHSSLAFIIGGSYGVSEDVKQRADYLISFSLLTFPHQFAKIMTLEQIYRCFKIIHNEKYHK